MIRRRLIYATVVVATAMTASLLDLPRPSPAASAVPNDPMLGELVSRNQRIIITSSAAGPRYSIYRDEKCIVQNLTLEQLRVNEPAAYQQIQSGTADTSPAIWAGLDVGE